MLLKNERYFVRHRLLLKPRRSIGAAVPLYQPLPALSAFSLIADAVRKKTAVLKVGVGESVRISHAEIRPADGMIILMFRRRNPNASTQVYEDTQAKIREANRGPLEDPAISAHLFIQIKQHAGGVVSHRAIMEEVTGLGSSYIKTVLDDVVKAYEYNAKDKRGQVVKTATKVDFFGVPSRSLDDAISKNGFDFIELVRAPDVSGLDTAGLTVRPERLRFYPARSTRGDKDVFKRVHDWAKKNSWEDMSVQVKELDKSKVVKVERQQDAANILFVRAELVQTKHEIGSCTDIVNEELALIAKSMLDKDEGWK